MCLNDIVGLMNISTKSEMHILMWLCKFTEPRMLGQIGNRIELDQYIKIISKNINITEAYIKNAVLNLTKKNILIKDLIYKNTYYINPEYFFKGDLKDREECCEMALKYQASK